MILNFEQIRDLIKEYELVECFFRYDFDDITIGDLEGNEALKSIGLMNYNIMEDTCSCNTNDLELIVYFKDHDIYARMTGEYDSYGGNNNQYHNDVTQVFPKQIVKTIYE